MVELRQHVRAKLTSTIDFRYFHTSHFAGFYINSPITSWGGMDPVCFTLNPLQHFVILTTSFALLKWSFVTIFTASHWIAVNASMWRLALLSSFFYRSVPYYTQTHHTWQVNVIFSSVFCFHLALPNAPLQLPVPASCCFLQLSLLFCWKQSFLFCKKHNSLNLAISRLLFIVKISVQNNKNNNKTVQAINEINTMIFLYHKSIKRQLHPNDKDWQC